MSGDDGLTLTLTSVVAAPRAQVFRMVTEPAGLMKWWGPYGFELVGADVDLQVGGAYRLTLKPPEAPSFHIAGHFVSVDPERGISYTFEYEEPAPDDRETVVELTLVDSDGGTVVSVAQAPFATQERLDLHRGGWSDSLERLKAVVEG